MMQSRHLFAAVVLVLGLAGPSFAQAGTSGANPWVATLIAIVLTIAILVASFMGSKRGHQD